MDNNIANHSMILHHYWRSSCSWRVRWALNLKGVKYSTVPVNILTNEHQSSLYTSQNPAGLLPTLAINGESFGESLAIVEWLEETHPEPPLLPTNPIDRLRVRQLAMVIASGTQPLQNPSVIGFYTNDPAQKKSYAAHWIAKGLRTYQKVRLQGKPGQFSFGDSVTTADLCLIPQIYNAMRFEIDMEEFKDLQVIYDRCLALPECNKAAPHNQEGAS